MLRSTATSAIGVTWPYMAPEILVHKNQPSEATDVWALVCTLKELFAEERVWGSISDAFEINVKLRNNKVPALPDEKIPADVLPFLIAAFDHNPEIRPATLMLVEFFNSKMNSFNFFYIILSLQGHSL